MQLSDDWRPSASLDVLQQRAALFRTVREFFFERDVLEVDTPLLSRYGVTDPHIENLTTSVRAFPQQPFYLQSSPEYAMKRLLAAYGQSIYQLGKVFRDDEIGRHHNPEFTMLEWYRVGYSSAELIAEVVMLLRQLLGNLPVIQWSYAEAFQLHLQLDPLTASVGEIQHALCAYPQVSDLAMREFDRDTLLQLAMSVVIEPKFNADAITVIDSFPASQAALAELSEVDDRVAHRFEVYVGGIELANGYQELTDPTQQQQRFTADSLLRKQQEKPVREPDARLLQALIAGLPQCSGVALGFDRLFMLTQKIRDIRQVLPFSITCA